MSYYLKLAGRLALLASRSTGLEKFGFIEIKPIFWDYPSFVLATEVSKVSFEVAYLVKTNFCAQRAQGAHRANYYFEKFNFSRSSTIHISKIQASKRPFRAALCSKKTHFRALRARRVREAKIFHGSIVFMPRRFQRAIARPHQFRGIRKAHHKTFIII